MAAERYEQVDARQTYRCGYYVRWLLTEVGDLLLRVPRIRSSGVAFRTLAAYARRPRVVDQLIVSCCVLGMSTRKVARALGTFLGGVLSAQTVSRIAQQLDRAVAASRQRPLVTRYPYMILDGVVLTHRGALSVRWRVLLCAYGITRDGVREFIDVSLAHSESAACWEAFVRGLYERGLTAQEVELIVTDLPAGRRGRRHPFVNVDKILTLPGSLPKLPRWEWACYDKKVSVEDVKGERPEIIIDGYNLIGRQKGLRGDLEEKRQRLIEALIRYRRVTGYPLTVVFDGWRSGRGEESREEREGVTVIFTKKGEQADTRISRLVAERGLSIVVSSDREVRAQARRSGSSVLSSGEFERCLTREIAPPSP